MKDKIKDRIKEFETEKDNLFDEMDRLSKRHIENMADAEGYEGVDRLISWWSQDTKGLRNKLEFIDDYLNVLYWAVRQ